MENNNKALKMVALMATTLRDTKEMPEGVAYAALMGEMSLDTFQDVVTLLVKMGICKRSASNLLVYVEPVEGSSAAKFMNACKSLGL